MNIHGLIYIMNPTGWPRAVPQRDVSQHRQLLHDSAREDQQMLPRLQRLNRSIVSLISSLTRRVRSGSATPCLPWLLQPRRELGSPTTGADLHWLLNPKLFFSVQMHLKTKVVGFGNPTGDRPVTGLLNLTLQLIAP